MLPNTFYFLAERLAETRFWSYNEHKISISFFLGMVDTLVKGLQKFSAQEWEKIHASRTDEIPQHELIAYSKVKRRLYVKYMFMRQSNARS